MKALTIWQPWASLIMVGAKPYEFRPKSYLKYVGAPAIEGGGSAGSAAGCGAGFG